MTELAEKEFNKAGCILSLWTGMLAAPFAFLLNLQISYMLVPWVCVTGQLFWLHLAGALTLLLALAGGFLAWRNWKKSGQEWRSHERSVESRSRFMAILGLMMSGLFSLIILAQWIANLIIGPCQL
jgi:hypothetical protein